MFKVERDINEAFHVRFTECKLRQTKQDLDDEFFEMQFIDLFYAKLLNDAYHLASQYNLPEETIRSIISKERTKRIEKSSR